MFRQTRCQRQIPPDPDRTNLSQAGQLLQVLLRLWAVSHVRASAVPLRKSPSVRPALQVCKNFALASTAYQIAITILVATRVSALALNHFARILSAVRPVPANFKLHPRPIHCPRKCRIRCFSHKSFERCVCRYRWRHRRGCSGGDCRQRRRLQATTAAASSDWSCRRDKSHHVIRNCVRLQQIRARLRRSDGGAHAASASQRQRPKHGSNISHDATLLLSGRHFI